MTTQSQTQTRTITLITGGSRGLGRDMALAIARAGGDVIITYQSQVAAAQAVVKAIEVMGGRAVALALDIASASQFAGFTATLKTTLQNHFNTEHIDHVVQNAGVGNYSAYAQTTEAQLDAMYQMHFKGPYLLTQALLPILRDGGRVLNISSGLTRFSYAGYSAYAAMKGAVEVLSRYQAKELADRRITVNTLAPGAIATDFGGGAVRDNADLNAMIANQTALGRVGEANDIGGLVKLLLQSESGWINGQRIEASGGIYL
jgi:NAD(P)-dependent dehydrogenase (short-subunit alcohol dehydrogenase family)